MTNAKELASRLNGIEYGDGPSRELQIAAREAGLVIVMGASDDLVEFYGAWSDEAGASHESEIRFDALGMIPERSSIDDDEDLRIFFAREPNARTITALWCAEPGYSWTYKTDIPHATFEVVEDGEPYCRGIVFALADVAPVEQCLHGVGECVQDVGQCDGGCLAKKAAACQGTNCGCTDGRSHSPECVVEASLAQGWSDTPEAIKAMLQAVPSLSTALQKAANAMRAFADPEGNMPADTGEFRDLKEALVSIERICSPHEGTATDRVDFESFRDNCPYYTGIREDHDTDQCTYGAGRDWCERDGCPRLAEDSGLINEITADGLAVVSAIFAAPVHPTDGLPSLEEELAVGKSRAKALVAHMIRMGVSASTIPVEFEDGRKYRVTVAPDVATAGAQKPPVVDLQAMVNRFLGWKLPQDFNPDCHIHFDREAAAAFVESWPVGTNLLTADQARAMFAHCLGLTGGGMSQPARQCCDSCAKEGN